MTSFLANTKVREGWGLGGLVANRSLDYSCGVMNLAVCNIVLFIIGVNAIKFSAE